MNLTTSAGLRQLLSDLVGTAPRWVCLSAAILFVAPRSAPAVTLPRLALDRVNGLSITGAVNASYTIQYSTNLAQPIGWQNLTLVTLSSNSASLPFTSPAATGNCFYRAVLTSLPSPTNMVRINPGVFTMGSPPTEQDRYNDEGPQTTVTLTRTFFMAIRTVTQGEYQSVTGLNPSMFQGDPNRPVEQVTWSEATSYCYVLTQRELAAGRILAGWKYRLPTEAEWEYARRAGTTNRFYYGDDSTYSNLPSYAWFFDNAGGQTQVGGQKPANPWGLYDMIGNVWQWCDDWYGPYPGGSVTNPRSTNSVSGIRVLRGGSWNDDAVACRAAYRSADLPNDARFGFYGFRVVLAPED